jgi:Protein of unknown function (DUF2938)
MPGGMIGILVFGVCVGVVATVTMDVLGSIARKVGLTAGAKGQWVGRWYLGIPRGQFSHTDIAASPEQRGEKQAALIGHYAIGIALAVLYMVSADGLGVSPDGFFIAMGYGIATCVFPWFLVLPALGFGVFGLRGPRELKLFTSTLLNHLFYGFGLWWIVKVLRLLPFGS